MRHHTNFSFRSDEGQAIVEFAIVLPVLVLLVFGITQFGLAFRNYLAITDAARVGARAAAVKRTSRPLRSRERPRSRTPSRQVSGPRSRAASRASPARMSATRSRSRSSYPYSIGLPGVSVSGNLTASAKERME